MINPLRIPIVLIVILVAMLAYVHVTHRERHTSDATDASSNNESELALRTFSAPRTAALRNDSNMLSAMIPPAPARRDERSWLEVLTTAEVGTQGASTENNPGPSERAASAVPLPLPAATADQEDGEARKLPPIDRAGGEGRRAARDSAFAGAASAESPRKSRRPKIQELAAAGFEHTPHDRRPTRPRSHRIADGDTLRKIAAKYLGDERFGEDIFAANPDVLVRPDLLPIGQLIRIPDVDVRR